MRIRHAAALACLLACVPSACTHWVAVDVPAPPAPMRVYHVATRVTLKDTRSFDLKDVVIVSDSLFGTTADESEIRRAFPLRLVSELHVQQPSRARSLGLAALIVLVAWRAGIFGGSISQ